MNDDNLILPDTTQQTPDGGALAADVIRAKVARMYAAEPNARLESAEAAHISHRSKHQQFMFDLSNSGKDLATIQTEWHAYYLSLPEVERHSVWQEFYASQSAITGPSPSAPDEQAVASHKHQAAAKPRAKQRASAEAKKASRKQKLADLRTPAAIKASIRETVTAGGKLQAKHHLQSLLFGLGVGTMAMVIFLFGFFNEVVIAPFIQPSRVTAATPLIISANSVAPSKNPEIIIPKINLQIPVDYSQTSIYEPAIQSGLEKGIVHYPNTVLPGENGNGAYFGHSSNNILNPGKYKFAFVLLHTIVPGDTFYLTKDSKVYVYKVISKTVVDPSEVGVLGPVPGQTATATLITCDPPGTSLKRLIVVGQQISPDVSTNTTPTGVITAASAPSVALPGNGPTLLSRVLKTPLGKIIGTVTIIGGIYVVVRWARKI